MCDLVMKNLFRAAAEAEQTLFKSAGAHLMEGRTPGEMAPGFYCSQTACPAQSFWEKFMAADRGKGFILSGCSKKLLTTSQPCLQSQSLATPSRTLRGKSSTEGKRTDMQGPTCFSVPLFASSHAWLLALYFFFFYYYARSFWSTKNREFLGAGRQKKTTPNPPFLS